MRMGITLLLLALVYGIFIMVLTLIGVELLVILAIVAVVLLVQYFFSDRILRGFMGARIVAEGEYPRLFETLTRLSAIAGVPRPGIAIVDSPVPNAFATGRNQNSSVIAVTSGLSSMLSQGELEAVLAHELSHVKNRDVAIITLAGVISTAASILARYFVFTSQDRGSRSGKQNLLIFLPLIAGVVWVTSLLLIRALSRYREFAADQGSAILTGQPSQLASALMKISGQMERIPTDDLRKVEGMNAFFIIPAITRSPFSDLLSTHPDVEQRIEALEQLERQMGNHGV